MDLGLAGKTALLLASTKGLAYGCAEVLVAEGVNVISNGRDNANASKALSKLGENAHFIQADITKQEDRDRLYSEAVMRFGYISILVTNADGPFPGSFLDKSLEEWEKAYRLVVLSAVDTAKKCIPDMVKNGYGRIINISSTSAKETIPGSIFANTLKPALIGAYGTLARELLTTGVTVNNILPGPFNTERMRKYAEDKYKSQAKIASEAMKLYEMTLPMKRIGEIEEFGSLCAFLCSRQAGYITGQSIVIDGGEVVSLL